MLEVLGACVEKQTVKMQNGCVNNLDELPSPRVRPLPSALTHTHTHTLAGYLFSLCIIKKYLLQREAKRK